MRENAFIWVQTLEFLTKIFQETGKPSVTSHVRANTDFQSLVNKFYTKVNTLALVF